MKQRIGIVGHGHWGTIIEKTLRTFPEVDVCIVPKGECDLGLDGVIIATPSATHAEIALPYIQKGIPTFIEKPLATSLADAHAIQSAAQKYNTFVQVGHIHTHNPALLAMRDTLPQLGIITLASFEHLYALPRTDSSVFWDCLPHTLSIALTLFEDEPKDMRAWSLSKTAEGLTEAGVVRFTCGKTTVFSYMNWLSPEKRTSLTLFGVKGTLVLNDVMSERKISLYKSDVVSYPTYDTTPPLTREIEYFLNAIRKKHTADAFLMMGVQIVEFIEKVEKMTLS